MVYPRKVDFSVALIFLIVGVIFVSLNNSEAAISGCPDGTMRKANGLDVLALEGKIKLGSCIDSNTEALIKPQLSGAAKDFLYSIRCGETAGGTSAKISIDKLNPEFAMCAANFLSSMRANGVSDVCLRDGYRTPAQQAKPSRGIKCRPTRSDGYPCPHPQGVAIDVNTNRGVAGYKFLHDNAPAFGLVFNVTGPSGGDPYHFEPIAHRRGRSRNSHTSRAVSIADKLGVPKGACLTSGYSPSPFISAPNITPQNPPTRQTAEKLRDFLAGRSANANKSQLEALCQQCAGGSCSAQAQSACQQLAGNSGAPPMPSGGQPAGQPQPAKSQPKTTVTNKSEPKDTNEEKKDEEKKDTEPKVVTAKLEPTHSINAESIFGKEENPFAKKPSTTTQEIIDKLTNIAQFGFSEGTTTSTTTKIHSIEVPLPDLVDVATVFEQKQNIEIKNIDYLSDGVVSIEVQLREPDGTSGVSGFFSAPEETFVSTAYNEGPIERLCKRRPWSGLRITSAIVSPVFDSVCRTVGAELGDEYLIDEYSE